MDISYEVIEILMKTWISHYEDFSWKYDQRYGEFNGDIETSL